MNIMNNLIVQEGMPIAFGVPIGRPFQIMMMMSLYKIFYREN